MVEHFELPTNWLRIRAADYGYASPSAFCGGLLTGIIISGFIANYMQHLTAEQLADKILEAEELTHYHTTSPRPSCWNKTGSARPLQRQ